MRVLVTGGTGYLGSAIVRALERAGHDAVVFARRASAAGRRGHSINGDVRDTRAVAKAAEGVDAICHTAALVAVWRSNRADFDAVNVGGLQSALAAARTHHIPRLVYTSSFLALPPAGSPHALIANDYQRTKVAARDVARRAAADGLPIVTLYPGVVYGPGPVTEGNLVGRLMDDHRRGRLPGVVGIERLWSFSFTEDVADAHVRALTHPSPAREYVVGGVNAPQRTIFEFLREREGRPLPRRLPYSIATVGAMLNEAFAAVSRRPPFVTRGVVDIFRHDWPLESAAAARELGLRVTPIAEGLARTLESLIAAAPGLR
ncbi:MAG TPA: NAD-dependent epimerase/dehydratase family protein [Vicinamibacterales bacterium]